MTPDDVAAIRLEWNIGYLEGRRIHALCDALEAAWAEAAFWKADDCCGNRERAERAEAERDANEAAAETWARVADAQRERAERAEADLARVQALRSKEFAQLLEQQEVAHKRLLWAAEAEAALARVRALCESMSGAEYLAVLAAIEGE